jgi:hypothetical protein
MKKNIINIVSLIIICCFFVSCVPERDTSSTMNRYLVNNTNKIIIQELETDIGYFELKSNGLDTMKVVLSKTSIIDGGLAIAYSTIRISPVHIIKDVLYCITDTTKFEYNRSYSIEGYDIPLNKEDSTYFDCITFKALGNDIYHPVSDVIFQYTGTIVSIMKKDYTMLDKFKEYYKK